VEDFDVMRPFTRGEAIQAGLAASALRSKAFRRVMTNVYVDASVPLTPTLRAVAPLALAVPVAWASHASAGRIHDVPLPPLPDEHVSVLEAGQRLRRTGVVSHVAPTSSRIVYIDGARVSAPGQMFVELAELLDLVDLVVVGDHLVRKGKISLADLREFCASSTSPGAAAARAAAAFVRERVDSPMETRLRMLIVLAGLPEPQVNVSIVDAHGLVKRRYDLSWPEVKVIVEYDGRHHIEREEQWEADLARREEIDDAEWRILVVTSKGVFNHPEQTLQRIWRLLRARRLPGLPPCPGDEWRPHFPGRRTDA